MSHKHNLATKYNFKMGAPEVEFWASLESNFVWIAVTLEARTSVNEKKTECSLEIAEDKKVSHMCLE